MRKINISSGRGPVPAVDSGGRAGFWGLGVLILVMPGVAHAYIDPGTGAYAIQLLVALFGAFVFFATHPVRFLRELIHGLREKLRRKAL